MAQAQTSMTINATTKELRALTAPVLRRLGYKDVENSKGLDQVVANDERDKKVGRSWWPHHYQVRLNWSRATDGILQVMVVVEEKKNSATQQECERRCNEIILEIGKDLERSREVAKYQEKSTLYGSARWGDEGELRAAGYFTSQADPKRLLLGKTNSNEYIQVPEQSTYAHAIVCGRTGVGKSRGFFIPQLVERTGTSMIVTEATPGNEIGELYELTSGWRKNAGQEIYCFNLSDLSSDRINPIDRVRWAPAEKKVQVAERLAELIIINGEQEGRKIDPTWDRSEKLLLMPLILHAAAGDPQHGHFGALRWLLLSGIERVQEVIKDSPSQVAKIEFEGWLKLTSENFRYGVLSGLITKLNPWLTDQIVALTETTDIDFERLKDKLFTFYIAVPSRSRDSKLIGSLMVNFLLDTILEVRRQMKYPMAILLDEFTNFGKITGIGDVLSIIRKAKIGLVLGFQNYYQLEQVYGRQEAQTIIDQPATQIYFKQKTYREARELSNALGRMTVEETTVSDIGRVQEVVQGRALATPEELINLKNEVIIFTPDTWPLKLPLTSPSAYETAFAYESPHRNEHSISEFIRQRGRVARAQSQEQKQQEPVREAAKESKIENRSDDDEQEIGTERESPDYGDTWQESA